MSDAILALNAGSSSVKFALFGAGTPEPTPILRGQLDDGGAKPGFVARAADGTLLEQHEAPRDAPHAELVHTMLDWIDSHLGGDRLVAVGHRVVHGGERFQAPVRLDGATIEAIAELTPLAPLHQPRSLEPIRAVAEARPALPQVACFDTAFHGSLPNVVRRYALPRHFEAEGIRKYGFHGLSYDFIASRLPRIDAGLAGKRTVVAHLGQGASLCALRDGRSLDTTMGFSALDGLMMGTRCGAIDPGILLYLQKARGLDADGVEHLLYHECGLLGVSGLSSDMRVLEASDDPQAREAIELFTFRIARETAALANTLGGLDLLVFTGGIGEHAAGVRAAVCERLVWLGTTIDASRNARHASRIDAGGRVEVRVIPTDEEVVIARQAVACLGDALA